MVHKHRSRSYPSVLVKNRFSVGLRSSGTPQAFFVLEEIGENKMESRFQRGDLHPSHKIAPGMVRNLNVIRTPLVFAPLEYVRKRGATAHFISYQGKVLNGNVGCSRMYIICIPAPTKTRKLLITIYFTYGRCSLYQVAH